MQFLFKSNGLAQKLLRDDPDRYIYEAVLKGVDIPLPDVIADGINDVSKRDGWNRLAEPEELALPTETWRECVARRIRCFKLRQKLASGEIHSINDLITYNLNIRQLAQDVIENCFDPELLWALYQNISNITVLDPTCGSGAFLLAGLNILEPLYDACLERMQVFSNEEFVANNEDCVRIFENFHQILQQVDLHSNRRYFILKSIILNNLYGVDLMKEATEICKLRLFLKLISQVDPDINKPNYGLEPLPDIDFNIQAGNTLVGFANYEEVRKAVEGDQQQKLDLFSDMERISKSADEADQAFQTFRQIQTGHSIDAERFREAKAHLRQKLRELNQELNNYLAEAYIIGLSKKLKEYEKWLDDYQPFHWFVEFYGIINHDGFNVIIGNPPYVEWSKVNNYTVSPSTYRTRNCGNIYTVVCERSYKILQKNGRFGMIVPLSCIATSRMSDFRSLWNTNSFTTYVSNYSGDAHPSVLFQGVKFRLSILLQRKNCPRKMVYSTHFQRWLPEGRPQLFQLIEYTSDDTSNSSLRLIPKLASKTHLSIFEKIFREKVLIESFIQSDAAYNIYAHRIVAHFIKAFDFVPYFSNERNGMKKSEDYKIFSVKSEGLKNALVSILNSSLFYSWFVSYSDVYHCGRELILNFPCNLSSLCGSFNKELEEVNRLLMQDLQAKSIRRSIPYKATGLVKYDEFYPRLSKPIIDKLDCVLAKHYGFTEEELDFVINYDVKYRMGRDTEDEE